jgi:ATP-dependent helicase/nuclease subunit B
LAIVDYKTGAVPEKREIEAAIAVQLPLEGAIARAGGFGIGGGAIDALEHWKLGGGDPAGKIDPASDDPQTLIDRVLGTITGYVARFDDPATPYRPVPIARWAPRFSDYAHLERLDESEAG